MPETHPVYFSFEASQADGTLALTTLYPDRKISVPLIPERRRGFYDYTNLQEIQLGDLSVFLSEKILKLRLPKGRKLNNIFGDKTRSDFAARIEAKVNSNSKICSTESKQEDEFDAIIITSKEIDGFSLVQYSLIVEIIQEYLLTKCSHSRRLHNFVTNQISEIMDRIQIPQTKLAIQMASQGLSLLSRKEAGGKRSLVISVKPGRIHPVVELSLHNSFTDAVFNGTEPFPEAATRAKLPKEIFKTLTTVSITESNPLSLSRNPKFVVRIERFLAQSFMGVDKYTGYYPSRIDLTTKLTRTFAFLRAWRYLIAPALIISITALVISLTLPAVNIFLLSAVKTMALFGLVVATPIVLTLVSCSIGTWCYLHKTTLNHNNDLLLIDSPVPTQVSSPINSAKAPLPARAAAPAANNDTDPLLQDLSEPDITARHPVADRGTTIQTNSTAGLQSLWNRRKPRGLGSGAELNYPTINNGKHR